MNESSTADTGEVKASRYYKRTVPFYSLPFRDKLKVTRRVTIEEAVQEIRSDLYRKQVEVLRKTWSEKDQKRIKKGFGAYVFGYNFGEVRHVESAVDADQCSWLVTLDFDALGSVAAKEARKRVSSDPATIAAFVSPRGEGLKVLVAWRGLLDNYNGAWTKAADHFLDRYLLLADTNGKDITRICYHCWDPEAYLAPADKTIVPLRGRKVTTPPVAPPISPESTDPAERALLELERTERFERAKSMLGHIDPTFRGGGDEISEGVTDDRDGWVKLSLAVIGALGYRTDTHDLLLQWSRNELRHAGAKWPDGLPASFGDADTFETAWRSFGKPRDGRGRPAGMGTVAAAARALGWNGTVPQVSHKGEGWEKGLLRNDIGTVKGNESNTLRIMMNHSKLVGLVKWNALLGCIELHGDPPWEREPGSTSNWRSTDTAGAMGWLQDIYRTTFSLKTIDDVVTSVARMASYHPVRDYLNALQWDGVSRIGKWLTEAFGVAHTEYTAVVGRKTLISAVARALRPGCKVDTMLILEGGQGTKKSTALRVLAGRSWFSDAQIIIGDKDALMLINRFWIYELPEMETYRRAEATVMKAFLSRQTDSYRAPYDRTPQDHDRGLIFIGTTNEDEYLKDDTGNRRYWPVKIKKCDVTWLRDNRDMLWAEAAAAFARAEPWWLEGEDEDIAKREQNKRMVVDPWDDKLDNYLDQMKLDRIHSSELMTMCLELRNPSTGDARRLSACMQRIGWDSSKKIVIGGREARGYQISF